MDESSIKQDRRSQRSNVLMAAVIEADAGPFKVMLRNLSADGALIEGDFVPEPGSAVVFRKKDLVISGRVAWVNDRRAGINFDDKLDPETVLRHIPAPKSRIEPNFKRPRLSGTPLSPTEQRWCESYIWQQPLPAVER